MPPNTLLPRFDSEAATLALTLASGVMVLELLLLLPRCVRVRVWMLELVFVLVWVCSLLRGRGKAK